MQILSENVNIFDAANSIGLDLQSDIAANAGPLDFANPLTFVLPLVAALIISMVIIPFMVHFAPRLGMVDEPDPRKVHAKPVPRVGGVGIVLGALVPIVFLLPLDNVLASYVFASIVLFLFGALDDCHELGHYVKFIGQFIAAVAVVYFGDLYVTHFPFLGGEPLSEAIGKPFTVFALVGMINAINHSDGLDGLAGGESLQSLCAIGYLSFQAGGYSATIIVLSIIGGVFGFMRFNSHPAVIFMGDAGSQFLGFSLGFLAVLLTQDVNPALSPALPLLLLGLPIADSIAVLIQRVHGRKNVFRATRNHVHHRLLDIGFHHYESVVIIYSVQVMLVISAVLMPYEADSLISALYMGVVTAVFALLYLARKYRLRIHKDKSGVLVDEIIESAKRSRLIASFAYGVILYGLSAFLVAGSFMVTSVPIDFAIIGLVLGGLMLAYMLSGGLAGSLPLRALGYMAIVFVVYLLNIYQPIYLSGTDVVTYLYFGVMAAAIALTIRFTDKGDFGTSPTDFLIILAVFSLVVLSSMGIVGTVITAVTLKTIILFYGCEVLLNRMKTRWNVFTLSILVSLFIISARGLLVLVS